MYHFNWILYSQWLFLDFLLRWFGLKSSGWVLFPEVDLVDFILLSISIFLFDFDLVALGLKPMSCFSLGLLCLRIRNIPSRTQGWQRDWKYGWAIMRRATTDQQQLLICQNLGGGGGEHTHPASLKHARLIDICLQKWINPKVVYL